MGTVEDWQVAQKKSRWSSVSGGAVGLVLISVLGFPASVLANLMAKGNAHTLGPLMTAWMAVLIAPLVIFLVRRTLKEQRKTDAVVTTLTDDLRDALENAAREAAERERQSRGQKFGSRLANAWDMAEGEPEVINVIERAFQSSGERIGTPPRIGNAVSLIDGRR